MDHVMVIMGLLTRACIDLNIAKRNNQVDQFHINRLSIHCQWFVFDSSSEVPKRGKVVFNDVFTVPTLMTSMTEATTITCPPHTR
jgi:hypothetical protein